MMSTRRSLFVIGCLMAAFVLFAGGSAFAQVANPTEFEADARSHDMIRVTWEHASGDDLDKFSLRYQQTACDADPCVVGDFDLTGNIMRMDVAKASRGDDYEVSVDGLTPGKHYVFGLTAIGKDVANSDEVYDGEETDAADAPDDVRNLMLTAGDGMIMAEWEETTDNGSPVTGYHVQYKGKTGGWMDAREGSMEDTSTMWTISNLTNGMEYSVRVRAYSYTMPGDWSDVMMATPMEGAMTPTPALPVFGAIALGAGLLAAGRARLRRRELRAGRTRHQFTR